MRLDKPIGSLLLLWPMLCALWLASSGQPDFLILSVFVLGTFLMRSAGCVINDIADRNFDGFVERTKNRVLASKKVSVKEALFLFAVLALLAWRCFWQSLTLLPNDFFHCRKRIWAWLMVLAFQWLLPLHKTLCLCLVGCCFLPMCFGLWLTTPNTQWWINLMI